jgi:hypothetical protein
MRALQLQMAHKLLFDIGKIANQAARKMHGNDERSIETSRFAHCKLKPSQAS